jgi:hypothetical protein
MGRALRHVPRYAACALRRDNELWCTLQELGCAHEDALSLARGWQSSSDATALPRQSLSDRRQVSPGAMWRSKRADWAQSDSGAGRPGTAAWQSSNPTPRNSGLTSLQDSRGGSSSQQVKVQPAA